MLLHLVSCVVLKEHSILSFTATMEDDARSFIHEPLAYL